MSEELIKAADQFLLAYVLQMTNIINGKQGMDFNTMNAMNDTARVVAGHIRKQSVLER